MPSLLIESMIGLTNKVCSSQLGGAGNDCPGIMVVVPVVTGTIRGATVDSGHIAELEVHNSGDIKLIAHTCITCDNFSN